MCFLPFATVTHANLLAVQVLHIRLNLLPIFFLLFIYLFIFIFLLEAQTGSD